MTFIMRGAVAAVGVGDTPYYKRGASPDAEGKLALRAIVSACENAGIDPATVDGFVSYADDANDPTHLLTALGTRELRWSGMVWGGGGGGSAAAFGMAAAAIMSDQADTVVVYRAIAERDHGRLSEVVSHGYFVPYFSAQGILTPAQKCAMQTQRMIEGRGVPHSAMEAIVLADYHHAQNNPRAQAYGRALSALDYEKARMIAEPLRLYDCSRENDAAGAVILTSAERARDLKQSAVYLLACAQGADPGAGEAWLNDPNFDFSGAARVAGRMWSRAGLGPKDVDVAQIFENFSGAAVGAMIDYGFCTAETAGEVLTLSNLIADGGRLPINTNGGLLGEGNVHGMGAAVEAVRQLSGQSCNPVAGATTCFLGGGPGAPLTSCALFGTADAL